MLAAHDIAQVADVRTVPKSRRHPHFHTDALARSLPERGLAYVHLPRLGGWQHADTSLRTVPGETSRFAGTPTTRWATSSPTASLSYAGLPVHGAPP